MSKECINHFLLTNNVSINRKILLYVNYTKIINITNPVIDKDFWITRFKSIYGFKLIRYNLDHELLCKKWYNKSYGYVLIKVSKLGYYNVVKYLVENKLYINAYINKALIKASQYGNYKIVKYLVMKGANIHSSVEKPLRVAFSNNYYNIVKYLVENGADTAFILNLT